MKTTTTYTPAELLKTSRDAIRSEARAAGLERVKHVGWAIRITDRGRLTLLSTGMRADGTTFEISTAL